MQNYKEINGNDYVKDSRTTINETMRSIQSMNSGTVFPTTNLFEGMKCYRTDLKKTYTLTDVENNTWVEDAHAELADEATHAASATRLQTPRALNLSGAVTADAANFDGTADATINVKTLDASKLKGTTSVSTTGNAATATKLAAARTIALSGNASGSTTFDGSGNATINATVNESAHAATATKVVTNAASGASANIAEATMGGSDFARIRVSGASDVSELALETADNGDEAIVARQYTGDFKDVARTASILDANGNTSFPGTVVAPKFTGALNGNAATASKLLTPRTISLTGKAAGSASFDGSSNTSINVTSVNADTASKLSTARKINITGNATGSGTFDGSGDISINTTVNESKHAGSADRATADKYGTDIADNYVRKYVNVGEQDLNNFRYGGLYANPLNANATTARHYPVNEAGSLLVMNNGANGVDGCSQIYTTHSSHDSYKREYDVATKTWNSWRKYAFEDSTVARALIANNLNSGADTGSITINQSGYSDYSPTVGGNYANMTIDSWYGVSFTSQCGGTVPKGKTAVGIDCREGIVRARSFEGTLNGTATNADTVDGVHAGSMYYNKGCWTADNWATMGTYQVNNNPPTSNCYTWGQVISSSTNDARFQLYASHTFGGDGRLHYRTGWDNDKSQPWNTILDSENYNNFVPTKTGSGASGTWPISISGNADKLDGYHANDLLNKIYPVGSIYMSMSATNPATLFGVGTWARISQGRMLLGADDSTYKAGATGGEATHTLTAAEMPAHSHTGTTSTNGAHSHTTKMNSGKYGGGAWMQGGGNDGTFNTSTNGDHNHMFTTDNSGGGAAHNNMPPYLVCYIWQRTA